MIRAVFMGSDEFSLPSLEALVTRGHHLPDAIETVGVVTQPDRPAGRGRKLKPNPVKLAALGHDVPVLQPQRLRAPDALESVLALQPDVIVVASFGQLLPDSILEAPRFKSLNLHPSLLPRWRGPSPVQGTILAGDEQTGTTLMLMSSKMDGGPILDQDTTTVGPDETAGELTARLAEMSANLLMRDLPSWFEGRLVPRTQDDARATYTSRISREDGVIDWRLPAWELARRVRAFNPWPVASTIWEGRILRLLRARSGMGQGEPGRVEGLKDGSLAVGTGQGILLVDQLQLAGGKPLTASEFVRGHPKLLRAKFSPEVAWSSV